MSYDKSGRTTTDFRKNPLDESFCIRRKDWYGSKESYQIRYRKTDGHGKNLREHNFGTFGLQNRITLNFTLWSFFLSLWKFKR